MRAKTRASGCVATGAEPRCRLKAMLGTAARPARCCQRPEVTELTGALPSLGMAAPIIEFKDVGLAAHRA